MKKLMTLLSAAAVAFGLQAADTGTSFEGMSAGDLDITSSTGELVAESSGYWVTNGNDRVSLKVVEGVSRLHQGDRYPQQYRGTDQENYLEIKTPFGNPVTRSVTSGGGGQAIGDGFYYDSLVKFTAFDEDPLTTAVTNDFDGAKIAVWLQEVKSEEDPDVVVGTNLYVRAGSLLLGGADQTYDCGRMPNPGDWHRLTIKAIRSIYSSGEAVPGFVVFIDNGIVGVYRDNDYALTGIDSGNLSDKYVGFYTVKALFPSMVRGDGTATSLSSVSFDGQGEVDDIVFTDTVPFDAAKDSEFVYVSWDADDVTAVSIDGVAQTVADEVAKLTYTGSFTPAISVTYAEGKLAGTWTGTATISGSSVTFEAAGQTCEIVAANAAASFNGTSYSTLAEAIIAANATTEPSLPAPVLKLFGTTSEDNIEIEAGEGVSIEIDLNGQTVGSIAGATPLSIVDSVGGGVVEGAVYFGADGSIAAGTYNAAVEFAATGTITGGRFLASANKASALNPFAPQGKEFGLDGDYLVLVEKAPEFAFAVTAGNNSYVSEVLIGNVDVTEAVTNGTLEVITSNVAWSVTFTANAGYQFETGVTTTNFTGTAEAAVAVVGPAASEIPATPSFTVTPGSNSTVTEVLVNGNDVTAAVPATLTEGDTWSVTFTADTDYAFDGGATTTNFTGTAAKVAIVVEGPAAAKQQGGWVDPKKIPENTEAGDQYPELADSDLAETDAKKLTVWAEANNVEISAVAAAVPNSAIYDAYLLGCEPTAAAVAEAKADFVPSISIVDGEVIVTEPEGEFNGTLKKYGSADLETWTEANTNEGYNFFKYELVP